MRGKQKHHGGEKWKVVIFVQSNQSYNINHNCSHAQQMEDQKILLRCKNAINQEAKIRCENIADYVTLFNFLHTQKTHMQESV